MKRVLENILIMLKEKRMNLYGKWNIIDVQIDAKHSKYQMQIWFRCETWNC